MAEGQSIVAPASGVSVEYRDVIGFPGYRVGSDGSVWSRREKANGHGHLGFRGRLGETWHRLRPSGQGDGHRVTLFRDGKRHYKSVSHIVLEAFVGPRPDGMEACHFPDRDPTNNARDNLRWDTHKANMGDRVIHETDQSGERHWKAILTAEVVTQIRTEYAAGGVTYEQLAIKYGVKKATIASIISRRNWPKVQGPPTAGDTLNHTGP